MPVKLQQLNIESNQKAIINQSIKGLSMELLNALENAILEFYHKNRYAIEISNPYWWFAEKLGYKEKNYVYAWFKERDNSKVGIRDVKEIYKITKNQYLKEKYIEEIDKD